jgi:hypothetical protein
MEYEVCVLVEDPPQYMKLYKSIKDYEKCNAAKIIIIGDPNNRKHIEQYNRLAEIHENVQVEFIEEQRERDRAQQALELCRNARHLHIRLRGGYI